MTPILITGLPRSGTTWVGEIVRSAPNTDYILEPDNEKHSLLGWACKYNLHRYPYLRPEQDEAPLFKKMWQSLLYGALSKHYLLHNKIAYHNETGLEFDIGERSGLVYIDSRLNGVHTEADAFRVSEHKTLASMLWTGVYFSSLFKTSKQRVVKSVHIALCLEWIAHHFNPQIVIVLRNPYSLYASYKRLKMPDSFRNIRVQDALREDLSKFVSPADIRQPKSQMEHNIIQMMLTYKVLAAQIQRHPEWHLISHGWLCLDPKTEFQGLFQKLGLPWTENTLQALEAHNKPGKKFAPNRISQLQPLKWQHELDDEEIALIRHWMDVFDLHNFFQEQVYIDAMVDDEQV